jgi:N-acetylneuraminic acid mutarotase
MNASRGFHTLSLLPENRVLAVGGVPLQSLGHTAEVYDVASNTWRYTGATVYQHAQHASAALPGGSVLVTGGIVELNGAEVYNPATNRWVATQSMAVGRYGHTATSLRDGRVLVVGGCTASGCGTQAVEIYDPASRTWSATGSLNEGRAWHTATLLPNGTVLVAGVTNEIQLLLNSAEVYNPATGTWTTVGAMAQGRMRHTAVLTRGGVMVVAGCCADGTLHGASHQSAEQFLVATGTWVSKGNLASPRKEHAAAALPDGSVLVIGGESREIFRGDSERWDPVSQRWHVVRSTIARPSAEFAAVTLADGRILLAGGTVLELYGFMADAQIFTP